MSNTATAEKPEAKTKGGKGKPKGESPYVNPFAINFKKDAKPEKINPKDVFATKALQCRTDGDSGDYVDRGRVAEFTAKMSPKSAENPQGGQKFPPIKIIRCKEVPGHKKDEEVNVCFDGMHTLEGAKGAKLEEVDALVMIGTWEQAMAAAAILANREHENNGKPLSSKDKIRACHLLGELYQKSDIPKKEWPSNRAAADMIGCSRQLVNDCDPFGRGAGDQRENKAQKKRDERAALKGAAPSAAAGTPLPPGVHPWAVKGTLNGQHIITVEAKTEAEAHDAVAKAKPNLKKADYTLHKMDAPAAGSVAAPSKGGFDWGGMDSHLGYLVRGWDGLGDMFNLKKDPAYVAATAAIDQFAKAFKDFRGKNGTKAK